MSSAADPERKSPENSESLPTQAASGAPASDEKPDAPDGQTNPEGGADDEFLDYEPLTPELLEEEAIRGDFVLRWAIVLMALLFASTQIGEPRTLLHIKTGEYLANHGWMPPAKDVFSYSVTDRDWTNLSWGFDLLVYGLHSLTGSKGMATLSLFKAVLIALSFGLLVHISRPGVSSWWGSICATAALVACLPQMTVEPQVMTILGVSLVLWILHSASVSTSTGSKKLWLLVPVFLIWANVDARAWIGLFFLLLFAIGRQIEQALRRTPEGTTEQTGLSVGTLWTVTAASIVVSLVNPFLFSTLTSPFTTYGQDYPALRAYFQQIYLQSPVMPSTGVPYFPLYVEHFWRSPDPSGIVAVVLMATAGATLILNWSRLDVRWLLVYLGAVALSFLAARELPVCSLAFAVVATLNGQSWFQTEFRQNYSVETSEVLFSRGGRAATVLFFLVIAFLGCNGWLRRVDKVYLGYGLQPELESTLVSMSKDLDDSLDDKPFNMLPSHGDLIIYLNQKPFIDSRLNLYTGNGKNENVLMTYLNLREILQKQGNQKWKPLFDELGITHILVRMGKAPDFKSFYQLAGTGNWKLTRLGAATAVLYRVDVANPKLEAYLKDHNFAFLESAFRTAKPMDLRHEHDISAPTFYEKYLWSRKRDVPNEIREALHLARLANDNPQMFEGSVAMAILAIRRAHEGLKLNPDSPEGYLALGQAYRFLATAENDVIMRGRQPLTANLRYFQAVAAFNQALVAEPTNRMALIELRNMYGAAGRADLQLRVVEALDKSFLEQKSTGLSKEQADELDMQSSYTLQLKNQLQQMSDRMDQEIAEQIGKNRSITQIADFCMQNGFVLKALEQLDRAQEIMAGNPDAQQKRIGMMLEAGRISEATEAAGYFEQAARSRGLPNWQFTVATACLPAGNYETAVRYLGEAVEEQTRQGMMRLIQSLQVRPSLNNIQPWPINATSTSIERAREMPHVIADARLKSALIQIERGDLAAARNNLEAIIEDSPDFVQRRVVAFYLSLLTGKLVDFDAPTSQVPILFEKSEKPVIYEWLKPKPAKPAAAK